MNINIDIQGADKVTANLQKLGEGSVKRLAAALYQEGEGLIAEAKSITPVDTGALRASGHVQQPVIQGKQVTVNCGFGGAAASYAVYVHENLEAHHPVGQAKFLEEPAKRRAMTMNRRIAERLK